MRVDNCAVYDSDVALSAEDQPEKLQVRRLGIGAGTKRLLRVAGAGKAQDLQPIDHYTPPPYKHVIEFGLAP